MVDSKRLSNGSRTLATIEPLECLLLLVSVELGLAAKLGTPCSGGLTTIIGSGNDPLPLVLCERAEECDEAATDGRREIQMGLVEYF